MDHFNSTVHNGALVSTRKGLLISKSKHQGTRFVNAFASDPSTTPAATTSSKEQNNQNDASSASAARAEKLPGHGRVNEPTEAVPKTTKWFDAGAMTTPSPAVTATTPTSMSSINNSHARRMVEEPFTPLSNEDGGVATDPNDESHDRQVARALLYTSDQHPHDLTDPSTLPQPIHHLSGSQLAGETATPLQSQSDIGSPSQFLETVPALTQKVVSQYFNNVPQDSHLYQAIAVVASLATEAGGLENASQAELATSIARVCATMNKRILTEDNGDRAKLTVLESIAAMAIDGMFAGQQRHWHVLMKTVRDIVDRSGGMKLDWGSTLNKIRKADIRGAVYAGTTPYLEFNKFFPSILESLPSQTRAEIAANLQHCIQSCNIQPANINSLQTLALFAQTVILARHALAAGSHVMVDPQGYAEDCLHVEYQLIRYPQALRSDVAESDQAFAGLGATAEFAGGPSNNPNTTTAKPTSNLLDPLLRVAAILYIEDLLPDYRSVDLYSILLTVLTHQIRNIILAIRHRDLDPQLHITNTNPSDAITDSLPRTDSVRPLLLWSCMIGHAITNFVLQARPSSLLDKSPFEDCVALLLAESNGLKNGDMDFCKVLPIRELRVVSCDESTLLRQIVAGYEAKQVWSGAG